MSSEWNYTLALIHNDVWGLSSTLNIWSKMIYDFIDDFFYELHVFI